MNLSLEEIGPVASGLITNNSILFFLNSYDPACDIWLFFQVNPIVLRPYKFSNLKPIKYRILAIPHQK